MTGLQDMDPNLIRQYSGAYGPPGTSTMIDDTIRAIMAEAKLKQVEARVILLRHGLLGSPKMTLAEMRDLFQADETITVKHISKDWIRAKQATALYKMRGAMVRLCIDLAAFRQESSEEPYRSLCEVLIGLDRKEPL